LQEVKVSKREKPESTFGSYRVLDLTDEKGLYCGQLLGSLGADVIKIEKPGGDPVRNIAPFFHDIPDPEKSFFWFAFNTNKRGITLDIETADGRELFKKLVKTADVIIESFPPGYMDELGLGYSEMEKINPGIVMTSITPFGQTGPYKDYKASDLVCWAMGGLLSVTGDPDRPPICVSHIPFVYLLASMDGALSTAIALYWRGASGEGQQVDVSIRDSASKTAWMIHEYWQVTGREFQRGSSHYHVPLADDFLKGIDWPNLDWRGRSRGEAERVQGYLAELFQSKTKAELLQEAIKRRIMVQPVSSPRDIVEHPQLEVRDYWQKLEHADLGVTLRYPSRFCLMSETPCELQRRAPHIGEHNQEIYQKELGYSNEEMIALKEAGII
jgi:crotonobetainyl-CoA:carnitine CoA-transferase CaiB-like acyl-CoA transferase